MDVSQFSEDGGMACFQFGVSCDKTTSVESEYGTGTDNIQNGTNNIRINTRTVKSIIVYHFIMISLNLYMVLARRVCLLCLKPIHAYYQDQTRFIDMENKQLELITKD